MDIKDMLELAAKAMQAKGNSNFCNYTVLDDCVCLELGSRRGAITSYWQPQAAPEQAFSLMLELDLHIKYFPAFDDVPGTLEIWRMGDDDPLVTEYSVSKRDRKARAMIALLKAAAILGKHV